MSDTLPCPIILLKHKVNQIGHVVKVETQPGEMRVSRFPGQIRWGWRSAENRNVPVSRKVTQTCREIRERERHTLIQSYFVFLGDAFCGQFLPYGWVWYVSIIFHFHWDLRIREEKLFRFKILLPITLPVGLASTSNISSFLLFIKYKFGQTLRMCPICSSEQLYVLGYTISI